MVDSEVRGRVVDSEVRGPSNVTQHRACTYGRGSDITVVTILGTVGYELTMVYMLSPGVLDS